MEATHDGDILLCPVLGAQIHAGAMSGSRGGRTGLIALYLAIRRLGFSLPLTVVLVAPVPFVANGPFGFFRNAIGFSVDLHRLAGHLLDRGGDSGILAADDAGSVQFHDEALDRLLSYAADGESLSAGELGRFVRDNARRRPDALGTALSYVSFAALLRAFGQDIEAPGRSGIRLPLGSVSRLYRAEFVPKDHQPTRRTTIVSLALTIRAMRSQSRGSR